MDLEALCTELQRQGRLDWVRPNGSVHRADANETTAFARQLEYIMTEVQAAEGIDLSARRLFPTIVIPDWSDSHTHRQIVRVGKAKLVGSNYRANEVPQVELYGKEFNFPVRSMIAGYNYSVDDVRRAVVTGINVDVEKGKAARRAIAELEETIAFSGDTTHGVQGLFSSTVSLTSVTQVSSYDWDHASNTPDGMLADVNALLMATWSATRGQDVADTLCLGTKAYGLCSVTYQSATYKNDTVLNFLLKSCPWLKAIEHVPWLDDIGGSSKERIFVYKRDPSCVRQVIAQEFQQTQPDLTNWNWQVGCRAKTGGIEVRKPKSIAYMDGVINAAGLTGGNLIA